MINYFIEQFKSNKGFRYSTVFFIALTIWWVAIYTRYLTEGIENDLFTNLLIVFPFVGGIAGLLYSKLWGGLKSALGLTIYTLSLGLVGQFIGTVIYNYYIYILGTEVPYPSIGDLFYFISVILFIIGTYKLNKVVGVKWKLLSSAHKFYAIVLPIIVLLMSYVILLRDYDFSEATPLLIFLDFGWAIGQVIYLSIALFAFFYSKNVLGGIMRYPILILISGLFVLFVSDFQFSYQMNNETFYVGGTNDYVLMLSYYLMTIALFSIGKMYYKIKET